MYGPFADRIITGREHFLSDKPFHSLAHMEDYAELAFRKPKSSYFQSIDWPEIFWNRWGVKFLISAHQLEVDKQMVR